MRIAFFMACFGLIAFGQAGSIGKLGYTCTDSPGEEKTCSCEGALDCWWMGRKGVCGDVIRCDLPPSQKCTCKWKQGVRDIGRPIISKHELKLLLGATMDPLP